VTVNVTCPSCQLCFPLEAGLIERDGKALAALMAELAPDLGRAALAYLALHKPTKRALKLGRAARIVGELIDLVHAGTISWKGDQVRTSPWVWIAGIERLVDQRDELSLPLSGHGLLRACVHKLATSTEFRAQREQARFTAPVEGPRIKRNAPDDPIRDACEAYGEGRITRDQAMAQLGQCDVSAARAGKMLDNIDAAREVPA
jgi:hypothetical protein